MATFWFLCFVCTFFYARSKAKAVSELRSFQEIASIRLDEAKSKHAQADELMHTARGLKSEAEAQIESTQAENLTLHAAVEEVVNLWVNDSWKVITDKLTASNYATQKGRMEKVFETCRKHGIEFDGRQERAFFVRLETEWKREVETEKARQEQQRIKEMMREEQRAEKMRAAELKKIEEEREELERKHVEHLDRIKLLKEMEALKQITADQQKELEAALKENAQLECEIAEKERRKAMAELTKAGNVYVISNVGSFGEKVFKVGMTRRLIPEDRIKELSDASVPFPFDCHMMIPAENAPQLESKIHEKLWEHRLNLVNDGKEFFKTELEVIKQIVDKHCTGIVYEFKPNPQAIEWRESEARRKQKQFGSYHDEVETSDETDDVA